MRKLQRENLGKKMGEWKVWNLAVYVELLELLNNNYQIFIKWLTKTVESLFVEHTFANVGIFKWNSWSTFNYTFLCTSFLSSSTLNYWISARSLVKKVVCSEILIPPIKKFSLPRLRSNVLKEDIEFPWKKNCLKRNAVNR
jgi:hypothetical protein